MNENYVRYIDPYSGGISSYLVEPAEVLGSRVPLSKSWIYRQDNNGYDLYEGDKLIAEKVFIGYDPRIHEFKRL